MPLRTVPRPIRRNRNVDTRFRKNPKCWGFSVWYQDVDTRTVQCEEFHTREHATIRIKELRYDPRFINGQLHIVISYDGATRLVHLPYR